MPRQVLVALSFFSVAVSGAVACSIDDSTPPKGMAGSGGTGGASSGGKGGAAGTTAGAAGNGGKATGGNAGRGTAGSAGAAGNAGTGGAGGAAGNAGAAGAGGDMDAGVDAGSDGPLDEADAMGADAADAGPEAEACARETDAMFCARNRKNCGGQFSAVDNCGTARTASCGLPSCAGGLCGSSGTLNVCPGDGPVNRAQGGTVDSSNPSSPPAFAAEDMFKAFDNSIMTKWYVTGHAGPTWIAYQFAGGNTYAITSYTITSGNDATERDPRAWELQGTTNGIDWDTLDTRSDQTFDLRFQTNTYDLANTKAYPEYRLNILEPFSGSAIQLSEIQLFGNPGPAPDAGDGAVDVTADVSAEGAADAAGQ